MIPTPMAALVLALGAFRLARLVGWDDFPPIQKLRDKATGAYWYHPQTATQGGWAYRRPLLGKFVQCAWCQGFWVSAAVYAAWATTGRWCLYLLAPFALSAAVGLIAKNLDP